MDSKYKIWAVKTPRKNLRREAKAWLREKKLQQEALPNYATPALLSADVRSKAEALDKFCRPIMTKPKPVAKPPEAPPQAKAADEEKSEAQPEASEEEPMETEKPSQDSA
ncbi:hypothetical protein Bca52824_017072 [Brassica carinata]|uniref:Uncharacterized protein n=1 Tax=Brassica carinata TaxID=52824 RepID=A0A8X7VNC1_BRACI|nr:hypothetical protein Bca52824_017072 [Brassica carinata]